MTGDKVLMTLIMYVYDDGTGTLQRNANADSNSIEINAATVQTILGVALLAVASTGRLPA